METAAHFALKTFAMAMLHQRGCRAIATEVRCPIARYRIDVAAWQDIRMPGVSSGERYPRRSEPRTLFVECKQSRADYLRDRRALEKLLAQRELLLRTKHELEERELKQREPNLRTTGESLFASMERWDFSNARSPRYRELLAEIARIERQLTGSTKFWYLAHHRLADRMFLAAPAGMIKRDELPIGWGLLECPATLLENAPRRFTRWPKLPPCVTVEAPELGATEAHRLRTLRNIAVAATFAAARLSGSRQRATITTER